MESEVVGLRAQDVYSGLQTVDQTSGLIAAELGVTRATGMAATVASNIKGIDVIQDPMALTVVAAQQWGIDSMALPQVLDVLEEVGYITRHNDHRGKVTTIDEQIPLLHNDMYERLGDHFHSASPSELDIATVESVEKLAVAPVRVSELADAIGDNDTVENLLAVGEASQIMKQLEMSDGDAVLWSPYCAYEQPEALDHLFKSFDDEEIRAQFDRVKKYQGLPVTGDAKVLGEAIGHGVLLSNSISGTGGDASFAFLPYQAGPAQRRMEKVVLERALILLACVRYGQNFAKHPIRSPAAILRKLIDRAPLSATTEAPTQYKSAAQAQVIRLKPAGSGYVSAELIDTPDNVAAAKLALDLLVHGEPIASREEDDQKLLFTGGQYLTPLKTMKNHDPKKKLSGDFVVTISDHLRGDSRG